MSAAEAKQVMTCLKLLDGFSFNFGWGGAHVGIIRGLLRDNDLASRFYVKDDHSVTNSEYIFRFKKNVYFFFHALLFFREFYDYRKFPSTTAPGFWSLIHEQTGRLFGSPHEAKVFTTLLISSRERFLNDHPGSTIQRGSRFPQHIQRLVLDWSSVMNTHDSKGATNWTRFSTEDARRLAERCSEWREVVNGGGVIDGKILTKPMEDFKRTRNAPRLERPSSPSIPAQESQPGPRTAANEAESTSESDDSVTFIEEVKLKRKRCSDSDSPQAGKLGQREVEGNVKRRGKRSQSISSGPKKGQTTPERSLRDSISPGKSQRSNKRFEELDKRLSKCLNLQLQNSTDLTSLDSRLQSISSQIATATTDLPDIRANITELNQKAARNADKITALEARGRAQSQEDKEHIESAVQRQLKMTVAEALHTELPKQLDAQLGDLVRDAISRIPIHDLVQNAVRETSAPQGPRSDNSQTRDEVIDRQRDIIRQLSEQVQNLERGLSQPGPPPHQPSRRRRRSRRHGGSGFGPHGEARRRD